MQKPNFFWRFWIKQATNHRKRFSAVFPYCFAIFWYRGKKVEIEILHNQTEVPGGYRYFWCYFHFINVKVWAKSFRMVSFRAPYDTNSILCLSAKFTDFRWKSRIFGFLKIFENPRFSSKITELCGEAQDRICGLWSSKAHHSIRFCP